MPDVRPLAGAAAAVTGLAALDVVPTWAGLPHHVALPPLDLFADARVLLAEAPSYPWFIGELVVIVGLRSLLLAAMLGAVSREGLVCSLGFYGAALPLALVAGGLGFAGVAAVYSLFLWSAVAVAVVTVVALGPLPWQRWGPGGGRLRVLGYVGALLVVSLLSALGTGPVQIALVWVSAGLTALTGRWLSRDEGRAPRAPRRPAGRTALALLAVLAVPLLVPGPPARRSGGTLFLVPGVGGATGASAMFRLDPAALGFDCDQTAYFSYAGPGGGAPRGAARCPITSGAPYESEDTRRPVDELAASFRAQLAELTPPVVVVAHSQGGWIVAAGVDPTAGRRIDAVVLIGAFPAHRRGYVLDGSGAGVVGTDALEALTAGLRGAEATSFDPRGPLARGLLGTGGAIDDLMGAGFPPGIRVATVTSAFDLPIMPPDWGLDRATDLCPVYVHHGRLPLSGQVHRQVRGFLDGRDQGSCRWWRRWPTQAFAAFGAPSP